MLDIDNSGGAGGGGRYAVTHTGGHNIWMNLTKTGAEGTSMANACGHFDA